MHDDDLNRLLAEVKAAAAEVEAHVVDTVLAFNDAKVPVARTDPAQTAALIRATRPRVVYCTAIDFDAGEQVRVDLFDDDADEAVLERPRIKRLLAKWRVRDGQTSQITATVMVDGILHTFVVEASWYEDYESDVEAVQEERDRVLEERLRREEADAKKRLGPMVEQLLADPRFAGPKVGNAKRVTLAQSMFPDADKRTVSEVVDMAESRHWLATGR